MKKLILILLLVFFGIQTFSQSLAGTYTIDNTQITTTPMVAGGNFHSFTDAVNSLNTNGISASVTFNVITDQVFAEDVPVITASGITANTITFQKSGAGVNPKITATGTVGTTDAGIAINGGDYFTFDGIDISISTGSALEYGYYLKNVSATDGAQYNTIKNCKIILNRINTNARGIYQNVTPNPTNTTGANSYNTFQNVIIENSYHGIQCTGLTAFPDLNTTVTNCVIGANSVDDIGNGTNAVNGIRLTSQKDYTVTYNTVRNLTGTGSGKMYGIYAESALGTMSKIAFNNVYNIKTTSTNVAAVLYAIRADINASNSCDVFNNMVYGFSHGITAASNTMVCRALSINASGSGTGNVYFNSVSVNMGSAATSTAFYFGTGTANVSDNVFANFSLGEATSKRYAIYTGTGTLNSNYNDLYIVSSTNNFLGFSTTDQAALSNWQALTGTPDLNSISTDPLFTSSTDLHTVNPLLNGAGTPITGITTDIDGDVRNVTTPDLGADEFILTCPDPSNLIFSSSTPISAIIDWTVNGIETSWNVQYGTVGFTLGSGTIANVTAHPATISPLLPSTSYDVYVQAYCGTGNSSAWIGPLNFTTPVSPLLSWAGSPFNEAASNDGSIANTVQLTLSLETFSISSGILTPATHYNITNLPLGLTEQINVTSATSAVISLTGQATNHANADDISNLGITFLNAAFTGNDATTVLGSSKTDLAINFLDPYSNATDILTYSFTEQTGAATIDNVNHTIAIQVNSSATLNNLIATFTLSTGAVANITGTPQVSGTTPNDFTSTVIYVVTAENGTTTQNWTVNVTVAPVIVSIVEWTFPTTSADAIADGGIAANLSKTITAVTTGTVSFPANGTIRADGWDSGMNTKYYQIEFTTGGYKDITLSSKQRSSSTAPKDFKAQYKIGTTGAWTDIAGAIITVADDYTTGVLTNVPLPVACNNQASLYIRWLMTSDIAVGGANVVNTGASNMDDIFVKGTPYVSSDAEIVSFDIPSQVSSTINSLASTVQVVMPIGTNLTSLIPAITVSVGAAILPASGVVQNFSSAVNYVVTAQDGTPKTWVVTVTALLPSTDAEILTFNIPSQISSTINSGASTISVVMPNGTDVTGLIPAITISSRCIY